MANAKKVAVVGVAATVVCVALVVFLWREGLSRADEWSNVLALFVALGVATGSLIAWSIKRGRRADSSAKAPRPQTSPHGGVSINAGHIGNLQNGEHNEVHGGIIINKEYHAGYRLPWRKGRR